MSKTAAMAEDGIINVDELGSEDLEPDIQYLGLGVPPGPSSHREKIMIIPATKQASCLDCSRAYRIFSNACPEFLG